MSALDDLVRAGKVRCVGFSDTPAWKVAEAQTIARFRGWAPLIALQIEYSLLERTVEGELTPMAQALGLGITPWSPLRAGVLSGKYSRDKVKAESVGRADTLNRNLNETAFAVVDVLKMTAPATRYAGLTVKPSKHRCACLAYVDRLLMAVVAEPVKAEFGLSDAQLFLLTGAAFVLIYGVF